MTRQLEELPMETPLALLLASLAIVAIPRPACAQPIHSSRGREEIAWNPVLGITVGAPYRESAYLGVARMTHRSTDVQSSTGFAAIAEGGRAGGQFAIARTSDNEGLMSRIQAAVVRTWGHPSMVAAKQTFVSAQIQASFVLGLNAGFYWRVSGSTAGDRRFGSIRFVVGF
jgi:hypothetical protein